jgi:hypothetical protein
MEASNAPLWEVPYLPIDPMDLGRTYEAVIRINSQSGKGGVAYIMEKEHGIELPRRLQVEFSKVVQSIADGEGVELSADRLWQSFQTEYLEGNGRYELIEHRARQDHGEQDVAAKIKVDGKAKTITGHGNGPVDGFVTALKADAGIDFDLVDYREHAMGTGANATAVAYVELRFADGRTLFGVGIDKNIVTASLKAVVSSVNRALKGASSVKASGRDDAASSGSLIARSLKRERGLELPESFEAEFASALGSAAATMAPSRMFDAFASAYLDGNGPYALVAHDAVPDKKKPGEEIVTARIAINGREKTITGRGPGLIAGLIDALSRETGRSFGLESYREHSLASGSKAEVASYVCLTEGTRRYRGVGIDTSLATASMRAVISAVNRAVKQDAA